MINSKALWKTICSFVPSNYVLKWIVWLTFMGFIYMSFLLQGQFILAFFTYLIAAFLPFIAKAVKVRYKEFSEEE